MKESYLGDGLYVAFDGFGFRLRAPHADGNNVVYLEAENVTALMAYVNEVYERLRRIASGERS